MIKIVLPFLLIGKALKPLAKIKKQAWKQMGTAFGSIKSAVDPMKSFAKIMEILNVIMLPLTFIMTLLASVILKQLMPYIAGLIVVIDDLGITSETTAENMWLMNGALDWFLLIWPLWYQAKLDEIEIYDISGRAVGAYSELVIDAVDALFGRIEYWIEYILSLVPDVPGGDGDDDNILDPIFDFWDRVSGVGQSTGAMTSSTSNTVNINLSNSIVDNRAKLIQDITEAVVIRIG